MAAHEQTPVVIEVAVNGETTKRRNENVPRSTAEIAQDAAACLDAGAAMVHNHTDDVVFGGGRLDAAPYLEAWSPVLAVTPDAILSPTMAGGPAGQSDIETRYAHMIELHEAGVLGMAIADAGSPRVATRRRDGSVVPTSAAYDNTPADIDWMFAWCREHDVNVHVSIFEPGDLRMALAHLEAGTLPHRTKLQFYLMGPRTLSGLPAQEWALDVYLKMLDGADVLWMVGTPGHDCVASGLARAAIERGGHVRVGLEDYYDPSGLRSSPTNVELVTEVAELAADSGRPVATPGQARELLAG